MDTVSYLPEPDVKTLQSLALGTAVLCFGWHDPSVIAACARVANLVVTGGHVLEYADPEETHHYRAVTKYLEVQGIMPAVVFSCCEAMELARMWAPDSFGLIVIDPWQLPAPLGQLLAHAVQAARRVVVVDRDVTLDMRSVVDAAVPGEPVSITTSGLLHVLTKHHTRLAATGGV